MGKYIVIGSINSQFEIEVDADSVEEARENAYLKVRYDYGDFEMFEIDDVYEGS